MSWILIEGLDRSGKSTIAEHYRKLGYKVVHMNAPDKKYFQPGYNGESYLEELVDLYTKYSGQKVLFDRTIYGEFIWPNVYGRKAMLSEEDVDYLAGIERNNDAERILMHDPNTDAHWQRCVANNEPLTRQQFGRANIFYERLVKEYGFVKKHISDFPGFEHFRATRDEKGTVGDIQSAGESLSKSDGNPDATWRSSTTTEVGAQVSLRSDLQLSSSLGSIEDKLERANAIRTLLQGQILKKKGGSYDDLELALRGFLQQELDKLFTQPSGKEELTSEEISILKLYVKRIKEKMN